jgi:uncharacterized protein YndB with AHSA1/START domain
VKWLKRIGLGVLALLLLAAIGWGAVLMRPERAHNTVSLWIDRPAAQVFEHFSDRAKLMKWVTSVKKIEPWSGEKGLQVGARTRVTMQLEGGDPIFVDEEIRAVEPGRRLLLALTWADPAMGSFEELADWTLTEESGRTRVSGDALTHYHGALMRLMEPVMTWSAQAKLPQDMARLKANVEAEPLAAR